MTSRRAACSCGQLHLTIEGEPTRISMCHCLECQRRTGAAISNQARFRREQVTFAGRESTWTRTAESGNALTFHFCPLCGSTVYWEGQGFPGICRRCDRQLRGPEFSRSRHRRVGGVAAPLGLLAARHAAQARGETGVMRLARRARDRRASPSPASGREGWESFLNRIAGELRKKSKEPPPRPPRRRGGIKSTTPSPAGKNSPAGGGSRDRARSPPRRRSHRPWRAAGRSGSAR